MNEMLLVVMLAGRRAALPAIEVNSVIELAEVTPVPRAAGHVTGLAALRSRIALRASQSTSAPVVGSTNATSAGSSSSTMR